MFSFFKCSSECTVQSISYSISSSVCSSEEKSEEKQIRYYLLKGNPYLNTAITAHTGHKVSTLYRAFNGYISGNRRYEGFSEKGLDKSLLLEKINFNLKEEVTILQLTFTNAELNRRKVKVNLTHLERVLDKKGNEIVNPNNNLPINGEYIYNLYQSFRRHNRINACPLPNYINPLEKSSAEIIGAIFDSDPEYANLKNNIMASSGKGLRG